MAIPPYQSFFEPVLRIAGDGKEHSAAEVIDQVAREMKLTDLDRRSLLPSGKQRIVDNRVAWSITYLVKAQLLERTRRGLFAITGRGREVLASKTPRIDRAFLLQFPEFRAFVTTTSPGASTVAKDDADEQETPEDRLVSSYQTMRKQLAQEVLEKALKCSPSYFEEIVLDVILALGYGGNRKDAGQAVGKSGDGGIDGIIKEDKLGLDVIYLQAKRWEQPVGEPELHKFAGSLDKKKARRGIFITTSRFTDAAKDYVAQIEKKIVLIDGETLAELMIDNNVGVAEVETYPVKRLDSDYFLE
jgi:restriction system protein